MATNKATNGATPGTANGKDGGYAPATSSTKTPSGTAHVVAQRMLEARLLVDAVEDRWVEVGRGLVLYVSFSQGASARDSKKMLQQVAKSVLTAPLSSSDKWQADHSDADSVATLCKRGEAQNLLVIPQASLVAKLEIGDRNVKYHNQCGKEDARGLYEGLVEALSTVARELVCGPPKAKFRGDDWAELQAKRAVAASVPPSEMFKAGDYEGKYSKYDDQGVPTHDDTGAELAKSAYKKLVKIFAAQVKKYEKAAASDTATAGAQAEAAPVALVAPAAAESDAAAEELVPVPEGMCLPNVQCGTFGGRQGFEMKSAGPFTHAFVF